MVLQTEKMSDQHQKTLTWMDVTHKILHGYCEGYPFRMSQVDAMPQRFGWP